MKLIVWLFIMCYCLCKKICFRQWCWYICQSTRVGFYNQWVILCVNPNNSRRNVIC